MDTKTGIKDVGYQLINDNDFDSNDRFKAKLKADGLMDDAGKMIGKLDDSMYLNVGRMFMETEGIHGLDVRYPSFNQNTQVTTMIRLKPWSAAGGDASIIHEHTALKLNADVDGDTGMTVIYGEKGAGDRFKFYNKGSRLRDANDRMIKGQAYDNETFWRPLAKDTKARLKLFDEATGKSPFTAEQFIEKSNKLNDNTGRFNSGEALRRAHKAKFDKINIGPISNSNFYVNDLAYYAFAQTGDVSEFKHFEDVFKFTAFTEQKIISAKKGSAGEIAAQIEKATQYSRALKKFAQFDETGLTDMTKVLGNMGMLPVEEFNDFFGADGSYANPITGVLGNKDRAQREKLIGSYLDHRLEAGIDASDVADEGKLLRGMGTINELYSRAEVKDLEGDPLFRHTAVTKSNMDDVARSLRNGSYNKDSFGGALKDEILRADPNLVDDARNLHVTRQEVGGLLSDTFVDGNGTGYTVEPTTFFGGRDEDGVKSLLYQMRNTDTDEVRTFAMSNDNFSGAGTQIRKDLETMGFKNAAGGELPDAQVSSDVPISALSEVDEFLVSKGLAPVGALPMEDTNLILEGFGEAKKLEEFGHVDNKGYNSVIEEMHQAIIDRAKIVNDSSIDAPTKVDTYFDFKNSLSDNIIDSLNEDIVTEHMFYGVGASEGAQIDPSTYGRVLPTPQTIPHTTPIFEVNLPDEIGPRAAIPLDKKLEQKYRKKLTYQRMDVKSLEDDITLSVNQTAKAFNEKLDPSRIESDGYGALEIEKASNKVVGTLIAKDVMGRETFAQTVFDGYKAGHVAEIDSAMSWNLDIKDTIANKLNSADDYIGAINQYGEAKMFTGMYANSKLKDMDFNQLQDSMQALENSLMRGDIGSVNTSLVQKNYDAIVNYQEIVASARDQRVELGPQVDALTEKAMLTSSLDNIDMDATRAIDYSGVNVGTMLKDSHEEIIRKAALERRRIADSLDGRLSQRGAGKKLLGVGIGLAVAGTLMAGTFGVAGQLDPDSKNGLGSIDRQDTGISIRKQNPGRRGAMQRGDGKAYMEKRSNHINGKGTSGVNNSNIIDAMKVNYGADTVKININNESFDDNNSKWLEREMSGYLL